ncbi:MAG: hydroxyquinol 1,2-dioxygenase [Sphingomonadaceae bacterium]|nr:hydroxyquinol 1,2-dioxygenase [Sphingomonadaceae bacterium]MCP5394614.1 hydroxyquinol 1,2-dioxygenase [Sphingomonadaceae bacterium]
MRDLDETSITEAVVSKVTQGGSARAKQINEAVVRHLHDLCRELELTEEEWEYAIDFLTRTGHMCSDTRQEFILLSDALGVSMLVDAINHRHPGDTTETTVFGPFFVENAPEVTSGADISGRLDGKPLLIEGAIRDEAGNPVAGAVVDIWHADEDGFYDVQLEGGEAGGRGRVLTDETGSFHLSSIVPSPYPIPDDGPVGQMLGVQGRHPYRPAHVHFMVRADGFRRLVTHLFIEGSDYLDSDVVFGVKDSLIKPIEWIEPGSGSTGGGHYLLRADIRLAPA